MVRLVGTPEEGIRVDTRAGNPIPNVKGHEVGRTELQKYERLRKKHGGFWRRRKSPEGAYNCAGHVWASRRTIIYPETDLVDRVLSEDKYRLVGQAEAPMPGDLVLYRVEGQRSVLHVAQILEIRSAGATLVPWVVSKWNDTSGEDLHRYLDVPYGAQRIPFTIEFWTDRES